MENIARDAARAPPGLPRQMSEGRREADGSYTPAWNVAAQMMARASIEDQE